MLGGTGVELQGPFKLLRFKHSILYLQTQSCEHLLPASPRHLVCEVLGNETRVTTLNPTFQQGEQ